MTLDYSATVDVSGSVRLSWTWNGLLGLGVLKAGVSGEIFASGHCDLNARATIEWCPPLTFGGSARACGNSCSITIGGRVTGWVRTPRFDLSASIAGALSCPVRVCASIDSAGGLSGAYLDSLGGCKGGIRIYGYAEGPGVDKSFNICLIGTCF